MGLGCGEGVAGCSTSISTLAHTDIPEPKSSTRTDPSTENRSENIVKTILNKMKINYYKTKTMSLSSHFG